MKSELIENFLKSEFESKAEIQGFETFSLDTVQKLRDAEKYLMNKSLTEELSDEENIQLDICKAEIGSLSVAQVINDESLKKEPLFYRNKDSYLEKGGHKYFKREGTPGNYKYYYTEAQYKKEKGDSGEKKEGKPLIATNHKDLNWEKHPYGGEYSNYKMGVITRFTEDGETNYSVKLGAGTKQDENQNASSLEDAIKKIDNYTEKRNK